MVRLYVFAEGQAEQTFANTILAPHLAEREVYMHKAVLIANSHRRHRTYRGGGRNFQAMQKDIIRFLKQERGSDVFFTSMIDLYALHPEFPGIEEAERHRSEPTCRVSKLEQSWAKVTGDSRFIPHIQLHEYEAYLFADIAVLLDFYEDQKPAVERLRDSTQHFESPEMIDDGCDTAPSKRIIGEIPRYERDKVTVGVQAAERIGLSAIRCKCPHFSRWVTRLEGLGA